MATLTKLFAAGAVMTRPGVVAFTVAFASTDTYTTGGFALNLASLFEGISLPPPFTATYFSGMSSNGDTLYFVPGGTLASQLVKMFSTGGTEVVNATSLSGVVLQCRVEFAMTGAF